MGRVRELWIIKPTRIRPVRWYRADGSYLEFDTPPMGKPLIIPKLWQEENP